MRSDESESDPSVNYGLWVMMCQCRSDCNKGATLVGVLTVETESRWKCSVTSAQFCCEPRIVLKNKFYERKIDERLLTNSRFPFFFLKRIKMHERKFHLFKMSKYINFSHSRVSKKMPPPNNLLVSWVFLRCSKSINFQVESSTLTERAGLINGEEILGILQEPMVFATRRVPRRYRVLSL